MLPVTSGAGAKWHRVHGDVSAGSVFVEGCRAGPDRAEGPGARCGCFLNCCFPQERFQSMGSVSRAWASPLLAGGLLSSLV